MFCNRSTSPIPPPYAVTKTGSAGAIAPVTLAGTVAAGGGATGGLYWVVSSQGSRMGLSGWIAGWIGAISLVTSRRLSMYIWVAPVTLRSWMVKSLMSVMSSSLSQAILLMG